MTKADNPSIHVHGGPDKEVMAELRKTLRMLLDAKLDPTSLCAAFEMLRAFGAQTATAPMTVAMPDATPSAAELPSEPPGDGPLFDAPNEPSQEEAPNNA